MEKIDCEMSSGNVFQDLGIPNPENELKKSELKIKRNNAGVTPEKRIGEVYNGRTIFAFTRSGKNNQLKYKAKCACGNIKIGPLSKLKTQPCRECKGKKTSEKHIGERYGSKVIISLGEMKGRRGFKVKCDCGNEFVSSLDQLKRVDGCRNCLTKYFPGMIFDGCTLLEKVDKRKWKILCKCGKEYISFPRLDVTKNGTRFRNCGCELNINYLKAAEEKIGYKFGKLKVIGVEKGNRHNMLICKCKCGNIKKVVNGHEFKANSCGCLKKENVPRGDKKGNARFTNVEINSIRELHASKTYTFEELSEMFDMKANYLTRILKGFIWKSLPIYEENLKKKKPCRRKK